MRTLISWWLFVKLTIDCIVNNSASTMSVLLCTAPTSWMRRRQRLVCASASSMALLLTPTQLVIWNYTNYWQCLATARCQGTLSRLNCLTLDDWLGIPRKTTATAFEVVCEWYVSPGWRHLLQRHSCRALPPVCLSSACRCSPVSHHDIWNPTNCRHHGHQRD